MLDADFRFISCCSLRLDYAMLYILSPLFFSLMPMPALMPPLRFSHYAITPRRHADAAEAATPMLHFDVSFASLIFSLRYRR